MIPLQSRQYHLQYHSVPLQYPAVPWAHLVPPRSSDITTGSEKSGLCPTFLVYTRTSPCAGAEGGSSREGVGAG